MNSDEIKKFIKVKDNIEPLLPNNINLKGILAPGGQGVVYRGKVDDVDAAVKIYYPGQLETRIEREIEALLRLNNPHIVKLLWSGRVQIDTYQLPAVATTLIAGTDLCLKINRQGLSHNEIGTIIYDIADAIAAMWEYRIVHRDLKPANILIIPNGRACVIDLGVARHLDRTPLTTSGFTWGTWGYMSPEQTRGARQLTCKSDVFALGVIAIECSLGRHPSMQDQLRLLSMGLHENLPAQIASWEFSPLLADMLHPRPTKRPKPEEIMKMLNKYS